MSKSFRPFIPCTALVVAGIFFSNGVMHFKEGRTIQGVSFVIIYFIIYVLSSWAITREYNK
jgi:hypothetical protein